MAFTSYLSTSLAPGWCLGILHSCTVSESLGLSSMLLFYLTVLAATATHYAYQQSTGSASRNDAETQRHQKSADDFTLRHLCLLVVWFFTFAFGCLTLAVSGSRFVHPVAHAPTQLVGAVILALCSAAYVGVHVDLGSSWSPVPEQKSEHKLVTTGSYR